MRTARLAVHPRIRGEDQRLRTLEASGSGSPPHTRGRSNGFRTLKRGGWFTPAYAGKIAHRPRCCSRLGVHPRIRGEDHDHCRLLNQADGSPPHTRGRFRHAVKDCGAVGFTPAYAGKITCRYEFLCHARVHPRIRGEDHFAIFETSFFGGSPPHTRGR